MYICCKRNRLHAIMTVPCAFITHCEHSLSTGVQCSSLAGITKKTHSVLARCLISASGLKEISDRSPWKLFIFIIYENIFRIKVSKINFINFEKNFTVPDVQDYALLHSVEKRLTSPVASLRVRMEGCTAAIELACPTYPPASCEGCEAGML